MKKISEVKHDSPFKITFCLECNEIFENDTDKYYVFCHNTIHNIPSLMMNFPSVEDVEKFKSEHGIKQ